jgi:hypothetical protein
MTHSRAWLPLAAVAIATIVAPGMANAQRPGRGPVNASQVLSAIDRGIAYLKREQNPRGNWNEQVAFPGGVTALCTLALLEAGVEPSDPVIQKALNYLRPMKLEKTYTVALQTMAICAAEPKRDMVQITHNVRWL